MSNKKLIIKNLSYIYDLFCYVLKEKLYKHKLVSFIIASLHIQIIKFTNFFCINKALYLWYFSIIFKYSIYDFIIKFIWFIDYNKIKLFIKIFVLEGS